MIYIIIVRDTSLGIEKHQSKSERIVVEVVMDIAFDSVFFGFPP
jgi:hypothetical protein